MKKYIALLIILSIGTFYGVIAEDTTTNTLINGDFETCDLTGWTASGDAFTNDAVTKRRMFWGNREFYHEGECHLFGFENGESATGELVSNTFTLEGTGYISFLVGGGKDPSQTFVSVVDAETGFQLFKTGNTYFDEDGFTLNYGRILIDARDYLGQDLYIKIVDQDDDDGDFSFINVDDFDVDYDPANYQETEAPDYSFTVDKANQYLDTYANTFDPTYRMGYHFMAPYGWINDPNGFSFYDGEVHLFYQHNPYSEYWSGMHWGHATTVDFIKWNNLPVALAPDEEYDDGGVYSGNAIEIDGVHYLMYTAINPQGDNEPALQEQAIAYSTDGIHYEKYENNPVITRDMYPPEFVNPVDMRDPNIFEHNGVYYAILGNNHNGYGQVAMFESTDFLNWEFSSVLLSAADVDPGNPYRFGVNWECPDFFTLDGVDVMIASPQLMPTEGSKYTNLHSAVYFLGSMDYDAKSFNTTSFNEIDAGHDFYAPQTMLMPDGRRVMIAWMQDWGTVDSIFTAEYEHGWAGAMTVPRELFIVNGELYNYPVVELETYRQNNTTYSYEILNGFKEYHGINGQSIDMEITIDPMQSTNVGMRLFESDEHYTILRYDVLAQRLILERYNSSENVYPTTRRDVYVPLQEDGTLSLRILLDRISLEVFANGGQVSMTSLVYADNDADGITFFSDADALIEEINKWDIIVD